MAYHLTDKELLDHLRIQLDFLLADLAEYEKGKPHFATKIASTLRTIFHNTNTSKAILPDLLERNGVPFYFRGKNYIPDKHDVLYVGFTVGNKRPLFDAPFLVNKTFNDYWSEVVYLEGDAIYTRRQLVLWAANKLGGAHVDPEIPDNLLTLVNGSTRLVSHKYGEETMINQVVYEMALQTIMVLNQIIPLLERCLESNCDPSPKN